MYEWKKALMKKKTSSVKVNWESLDLDKETENCTFKKTHAYHLGFKNFMDYKKTDLKSFNGYGE